MESSPSAKIPDSRMFTVQRFPPHEEFIYLQRLLSDSANEPKPQTKEEFNSMLVEQGYDHAPTLQEMKIKYPGVKMMCDTYLKYNLSQLLLDLVGVGRYVAPGHEDCILTLQELTEVVNRAVILANAENNVRTRDFRSHRIKSGEFRLKLARSGIIQDANNSPLAQTIKTGRWASRTLGGGPHIFLVDNEVYVLGLDADGAKYAIEITNELKEYTRKKASVKNFDTSISDFSYRYRYFPGLFATDVFYKEIRDFKALMELLCKEFIISGSRAINSNARKHVVVKKNSLVEYSEPETGTS